MWLMMGRGPPPPSLSLFPESHSGVLRSHLIYPANGKGGTEEKVKARLYNVWFGRSADREEKHVCVAGKSQRDRQQRQNYDMIACRNAPLLPSTRRVEVYYYQLNLRDIQGNGLRALSWNPEPFALLPPLRPTFNQLTLGAAPCFTMESYARIITLNDFNQC